MRVSTRLPCEWQTFDHAPSRADVYAKFGLSALPEADDDLREALQQVHDPKIRYALEVMERRLERLENRLVEHTPAPPVIDLCLSAGGLALEAPEPCAVGAACGVHIVLDGYCHVVTAAEITRCEDNRREDTRGYRIGMRFVSLDADSQRRLSRYLLRGSPRQD